MVAAAKLVMEARQVDALPRDRGWQFEPKWDGFRCLAGRSGHKVELIGRSGKSLARYFPEMVAALRAVTAQAASTSARCRSASTTKPVCSTMSVSLPH